MPKCCICLTSAPKKEMHRCPLCRKDKRGCSWQRYCKACCQEFYNYTDSSYYEDGKRVEHKSVKQGFTELPWVCCGSGPIKHMNRDVKLRHRLTSYDIHNTHNRNERCCDD